MLRRIALTVALLLLFAAAVLFTALNQQSFEIDVGFARFVVSSGLALLIAWAATAAILFSATTLYRLLGPRALTALERLMGMVLVAISVQMTLDGIAAYLGPAGG